MKDFPSISHLTAGEHGDWPALLAGAQTTASLGWIIDYLFSFCSALPGRCEFHREVAASSSGEEMGEAKKRKLEESQSEEAELNK